MKILVVCQYYAPEPFRIADLCGSLVRRGHRVTVLTGLPNYPEGRVLRAYRFGRKRREILDGVSVVRCFTIGRGRSRVRLALNYLSFMLSASLRVLSLGADFDLAFVNQLSPVFMAIPALVFKKLRRRKVLLYCLDLWPASLAAGGVSEASSVFRKVLRISRWIYASADRLLVSSTGFRDYFQRVLSLEGKEIVHLPQYAEDLFQAPAAACRDDAATGDGKATADFVYAGNVGAMQSVETIVRAARILSDRRDLRFHIVGDGSRLPACRKLAEEQGLVNVVFHGRQPVDRMPDFYGMADAMLVTLKRDATLSDTLPGKVQSYLAAGKPILAAADGETRRVVEEAGCGLCCAAEDPRAFADAIAAFLDASDKTEMGRRARDYYEKHFEKEGFLDRLTIEFERLVRPEKPGGT